AFSETHEVKFLGHIISESGVRPDPDKTRAVLEMKEPSTISGIRSFLGMVNQLGKFIPCLAEKDGPLREFLSKRFHWGWGKAQQEAFSELKWELSSTPVLALYNPNKELKLSADASSYGLGAVLLQKEEELWKPVAYASRSLMPTEQRYAQVEKEHHSLLIPSLPDYTTVAAKEKGIREKQTASYNTRHRARQLSHLSSGQRVWITDTKTEGTVVASHSAPRSYLVESPQGILRRNRRHLVPMPNIEP
uniref:Reverse transcriptase/retrotransposon-derived protein RNase H-like domain-containing protein n=1 Tax=Sinocyclocheilus anshuiensis TaxID=1608454 RepID=A0A671M6W2_9TELE